MVSFESYAEISNLETIFIFDQKNSKGLALQKSKNFDRPKISANRTKNKGNFPPITVVALIFEKEITYNELKVFFCQSFFGEII